MSVIDELRAKRKILHDRLTVLAGAATADNRAFTESEQRDWETGYGELTALDQRIGDLAGQEHRTQQSSAAFDRLSGGASYHRPQNTDLRAWLRGDPGTPRHFDVRPDAPIDYRVLSKLTAGAGANTVPTSFYDRLIAHLIDTATLAQKATVLNTNSGESLQVPKTTAHSSAAIVTEGAAIGASDPAFGQVTLAAYKYGFLLQISRELVDDTGVDLEGYLSMQAGRALGNALGAHLVTGTGTGQPRGVVTDATVGVTGGAGVTGAFTADNLVSLYHSVLPAYRNSPSCAWVMRDATWAAIRTLKDTTGQYLIGPIVGSVDMMLLGKPVLIDPNVAAVATSAKSVVFGDLSQYFVRIAGGIRFERSDDFAFSTDLVTYRALLRADGALVDLTGAVKVFVGNAA